MGLTGASQSYTTWTFEEDGLVRALFPAAAQSVRKWQAKHPHVLPMSRGGLLVATNLLPACRKSNFQKRNKTLEEWHASLMRKET